jgi:hypothetical protein
MEREKKAESPVMASVSHRLSFALEIRCAFCPTIQGKSTTLTRTLRSATIHTVRPQGTTHHQAAVDWL